MARSVRGGSCWAGPASVAVALLLLVGVSLATPPQRCDLEIGTEYIPASEVADTARLLELVKNSMDNNWQGKDHMARFVHAKGHGCVAASFEVLPSDDPRTTVGLFAKPAIYSAWLRMSNGKSRNESDAGKDLRGMALKVMGVAGPKLLGADEEPLSQDFLLMSAPQFFLQDTAGYLPLLGLMGEPVRDFASLVAKAKSLASFLWSSIKQGFSNILLIISTLSAGAQLTNPLFGQYWSAVPYALDPAGSLPPVKQAVKYMMKPCEASPAMPNSTDAFYQVRQNVQEHLASGPACFDFYVQFQLNPCLQMIEDSTVEWLEKDSPFVKVAQLRIPKQTFTEPEQLAHCESLSMTPWHSLPHHRPLGGINRPRKEAYTQSSLYRHTYNQKPRTAPSPTDPAFVSQFGSSPSFTTTTTTTTTTIPSSSTTTTAASPSDAAPANPTGDAAASTKEL